MLAKLARLTPVLFAGAAAAAAIAVAPAAYADPPPPPPCTNWDGTPCSSIANVNAGGADINIPYGPSGTADRGSASGGASTCIPNVGCMSIPPAQVLPAHEYRT